MTPNTISQSHYDVYLLTALGLPRDHHSIYIINSPPDSPSSSPSNTTSLTTGHIFQVSGNIQLGMSHNHRPAINPESEPDFISKKLIGRIKVEDYETGKVEKICDALPAPKKQFDGLKRLFPGEKIRRCQEWTREAVQALKDADVLRDVGTGYVDENDARGVI